ncbi:undecaprenyl/decaprenyl-phosphate alpha-N-acetylglucosaminyl 1-phosphate transferase, partial [Candidatus Sumerlaeota bacterium]|nr:undecaprenyl/decaprenyl-phosphate alpha-N-acetylglucosaminyl 1-phosphate transferase [Candidatus Sumerlaeota bacterium]
MALSLLLGAATTSLSIRLAHKFRVLAMPSARGSHQVPTPRLGGFGYFVPLTAIVPVLLLKLGFSYSRADAMESILKTLLCLVVVCGSLAFLIGLMDDILRLPAAFKLFGQIICAALFIHLSNQISYEKFAPTERPPEPGRVAAQEEPTAPKRIEIHRVALTRDVVLDNRAWSDFTAKLGKFAAHIPPLSVIVAFLWIIAMMNAYNFMDGIDGLAATFLAAVAVGLFAVYVPEYFHLGPSEWRPHANTVILLAATLIGLSVGFLLYNWPPASTFLGDCGSQYVGFIISAILAQVARLTGVLGLSYTVALGPGHVPDSIKRAYVDFLAIVILVFPFLYDVTYTLARRLVRGKPIWRAHHEHLYQR